jgi:hypothetical protein
VGESVLWACDGMVDKSRLRYLLVYTNTYIIMSDLICINCGLPREKGRRICRECNLLRLRKAAKKRQEEGKRTMYQVGCLACFKSYTSFRNKESFCIDCRNLRKTLVGESNATNQYTWVPKTNKHLHRAIAEEILGKLKSNEVVHHINLNYKDNSVENLMVLDRKAHSKLHKYLDDQRIIIEKSIKENCQDSWEKLIIPLTTAWLEMMNVKFKRLNYF